MENTTEITLEIKTVQVEGGNSKKIPNFTYTREPLRKLYGLHHLLEKYNQPIYEDEMGYYIDL